MKKSLCLVLILGLATFLRIYQLADNPPALNWDEVSHGYNAYSILKTGRDEWGRFLPLANFRAYGDYPLPANLYLTIPSIFVFGLNEFGIRFPHALLGTLTVLFCFFLAQGLGLSLWISLLVSFLVAIDPWTLFPSRFVVQSNVGLFFLTAGLTFFLHRQKKPLFLLLFALAFGLSVYSYHNTRIFVPLFLAFLIFLYWNEWKEWWQKRKTYLLLTIVLLLVFFLPLIPIILGSEARARAQWVSIVDQGAINEIVENRLNSNLPSPLSRLIYNRLTYFLSHFLSNYIGYFSPSFLFFNGGTQYQFSVPGKGVLYPGEMLFFYLGLFLTVFRAIFKKNNSAKIIFFWLIFSLIPAAITRGGNHVIRASTIIPLPQILVASGFSYVAKLLIRRQKLNFLFGGLFILVTLFSLLNFLKIYFGSYRQNYSWAWQYGYKEMVSFLKENYHKYDKIIITKKYGEPHEFVLFWWPWDPDSYRNDPNLVRYFRSNWYWVDSFDKFYFINDWEVKEKAGCQTKEDKCLLVTSPGNYSDGWRKIKTIDFLDSKPAFEILEY